MTKLKKAFLFALCLVPIAAVAGAFVGYYELDVLSAEAIDPALAQFGSVGMLILVTAIQTAVYALLFGFFGYLLADKTGLWKPVKLEKKPLTVTLIASVLGGILCSLDYWTFGNLIEGIQDANAASLTVHGVIASVLYGGVIEELMMRLFLMSLIVLVLWKLFFRKRNKSQIPTGVFVTANILAAFLFAAGHIPATIGIFGSLTPLILFRCFLLNGVFALLFGRLYRKYGIVYAMMSHALFHVVSKVIWLMFV